MLGYSSSKLNRYFMMLEAEIETAEKPSPRPPHLVRRALRESYDGSESWNEVATVLTSVDLKVWKAWKKFIRRRGPTRPFLVADRRVSLTVDTAANQAEIASSARIDLVIPSSWIGRP